MIRRALLAAPALALLPRLAQAATPVVVELFTSQGCSSCPPADALLTELARDRPDVLALSFHITYWDRLGWRDPYSLPEATQRQRHYGATLGQNGIYTPQLVVQGRRDAVGSDRAAVLRAIAAAPAATVPLSLGVDAEAITVSAGAGAGTLWLIGFDRRHVTPVRGGENGGRTLSHSNVVRSLSSLGAWQGQPIVRPCPVGERFAVLLQAADGGIGGAASTA